MKPGRGRLFTDHDSTAQLLRAAAPYRAVPSRRAVALREGWSREGELLPRRSLSTRRSFTRRLVGQGGNGLTSQRLNAFTLPKQRERVSAFTLLELLIVVGIIALLLVLIAPAFTYIKGGTDVTSAAYTIKGVLDTARTYATANNTYTWVGFFEENVANPASPNSDTPAVGRLVMSIVASKDGPIAYDPTNLAQQDLTTKLIQVGKLTKIDNVHLWTHTDIPSGAGSTFDTRPNVASTYCIGDTSPSNSTTPFQYPVGNPAPAAQYTFVKAVQFSPRGEAQINNSTVNASGIEFFPLQTAAEIGLVPTHGAATPSPVPANIVAIQFTGIGGNVRIYRR